MGWEKECTEILGEVWRTKKKPWFLTEGNFDEFNQRAVDEYKNYSVKKLIEEWKYWQGLLDKKIEEVGEDKLKAEPELFGWVFDEGEESHYSEHLKQIKKALKK
ncbi:MAG: hypothetical protein ABIA78_01255 [archaeon]